MEPSKRDWKLCREKVSGQQEYYMGQLIEDCVTYLNSDEPASTKFWTMRKRMRQDKKTPGVCIKLGKGNMIFDLVRFLQDEVVVFDDLDEFSEELRESVKLLKERFDWSECRGADYYEWRCEYRYIYMEKCNRIIFRVEGVKDSMSMGDQFL